MEVSGQLLAAVALPPWETTPDTNCVESWVGLRAGLEIMENKNPLALGGGIKPLLLCLPTHSIVIILS
jgi:hypothetical protein